MTAVETEDSAPVTTQSPPIPAITEESSRRPSALGVLEAYALVVLLVGVGVFFSLYGPTSSTFPTSGNLQVLFGGQAVLAIVALAVLVPLICGEFDLSVGAVAGLCSVVCASALSSGVAVPLAVLLAIGLGMAFGIVNALLITRVKINSFIATLGVAAIVDGIVTQKTGGLAVVSNIPAIVTSFGSGNWLGIPRPAYVLAAVAVAVYYVLAHTPYGRYIQALGSNREAARLVGLRTDLLLGLTFVAAGTLAGTAGALQVARAGGADPRVGATFLLPAFAAAFLSAAAIKPGKYNVGGTLVAVLFLAALNSGLNLTGTEPYVSQYVNGAALLIGVGLAAYLGRKRLRQATARR